MNYEIGNAEMAWLLAAVPAVAALCIYSFWSNHRARRLFGTSTGSNQWVSRLFSGALLSAGIALLVLACMDIRWGKTTREVPQRGLEVVFALDVSRSMLAQDAKPNRLSRAKQQIKDMLSEMAGDRVGLVVFAGEANQTVPLTNHYHDFQQRLDSVGPESVPVGGSQLGVAIKVASEAFLSKTNDHKTVVLFTDGEDQESQPIELASKLHAENGLRIFTVGLGDMTEGARIPNDANSQRSRSSQFVQHNGQQVWSKLNGSILKQIATETNAAYIPAGTKRVNMADVYHRYIANVEKEEFETAKIDALLPRYQWFAFPAFLCIVLAEIVRNLVPHQRQKTNRLKRLANKGDSNISTSDARSALRRTAAILFPFILLQPTIVYAQSDAAKINAANDLLRQQKTAQAIDAYNAIDNASPENRDSLQYNLASAHYRDSDIEAAEAIFAQTVSSQDNRIARDSRYNLGNCHYAKALPMVEQQPELAIVELEKAITQYREALRLERSFADARENLERARKLIQQLRQEQEDKQQQNEQQSQKGEDSKQDQQNSQSQDNSDENQSSDDSTQDSENSNEQQDNRQSNGDQTNQRQDDSSEANKQKSQQSNEGEGPVQQQNQPEDAQDSQSGPDQPLNQQAAKPRNQRGKEPPDKRAAGKDEIEDGKEPPKGDLSAANETESDASESGVQSAKATLADQINEDTGLMTRQEALKLLQAVRDRDMLRRFRKKQRQRQNRVQVERDW